MPSLCSHSLMLHWLLNIYNLFLRGILLKWDSDHVIPLFSVLGKHMLFPLKSLHNSPPFSWSTWHHISLLSCRHFTLDMLASICSLNFPGRLLLLPSLSPLNVFPYLCDQPCPLLSFFSVLWDPHSSHPPQVSSIIYIPGFPGSHFLSTLYSLLWYINFIYHVEYKFTGQELWDFLF